MVTAREGIAVLREASQSRSTSGPAARAGQKSATVPDDLAAALAADPQAKAFFETLTGANRYAILYRINDAKKPQTRAARIVKFVEMCHHHETVH